MEEIYEIINGVKHKMIPIEEAFTRDNDDPFYGATKIDYEKVGRCLIEKGTGMLFSAKHGATIPDGVKTISNNAFQWNRIKRAVMPSSLEEIGDRAFNKCSRLRSVVLNEGLKIIGRNAFRGTKVKSIHIPASVEWIGSGAFSGIEVTISESNKKYELRGNCLIEKDRKRVVCANINSVIPKDVREIDENAFQELGIETITIPSGVEEIEEYSFYGCKKLKQVVLNEGLKSIWYSAFEGTKLSEVTIPSSVEKISSSAFKNVTFKVADEKSNFEVRDNCLIEKRTKKLVALGKGYKIPNDIKSIAHSLFFRTKLKSITMPPSLEEIGSHGLYGCRELQFVTLNEGLKKLDDGALMATGIKSITMPSTLTEIGGCAFLDCTKLKSVVLNEGLRKIGEDAFKGTKIESIVIPSTVEEIELSPFQDVRFEVAKGNIKYEASGNCLVEKETPTLLCGGKHSHITNDIKVIASLAFEYSKIKSIVVPGNVEEIQQCAFSDCKKLKHIELKEGIRRIEGSTFSRTGIKSIVIPNSVEEIDGDIFGECKRLKTVYCKTTSQPEKWDQKWNMKDIDYGERTMTKYKVVWGYKE